MTLFRCRTLAFLSLSAAMPAQLLAQTSEPAPVPTLVPTPVEPDVKFAEKVAEKRVFLPADFERFAPKTALDMVNQLPGFTLVSASSDRGLGQASENV
jgi:hypothetical protein